jgi:hypothetical protein
MQLILAPWYLIIEYAQMIKSFSLIRAALPKLFSSLTLLFQLFRIGCHVFSPRPGWARSYNKLLSLSPSLLIA